MSALYPVPPSHKTFTFDNITISSDFDSGNCCNAEKVSNNQFNLWIATDNPKNNYRTWFHFSIKGASKGTTFAFTMKNMQNQSRLLNQGLVPVYREQGKNEWKRISQKVNTSAIEYNEGWIQWTFKHNFKSSQTHYFAFFYPWSNEQNSQFLSQIQQKAKQNSQIYCYRAPIIKSIEGRPVQFLILSSYKHKMNKEDQINDQHLFKGLKKPNGFSSEKQGIVISARVHPGQVPGSHVMTGIIKTLIQTEGVGKLLRDQFVFYIFPILNPDGVARGHYRVDTNGINLNRCYINPSPKQQPSIYAIRKFILHLHSQNRFYAFLDLHAHAARKGTFIYGNCSNQLLKQVKACLFPKIMSMNSADFQYQGSNFTQKNMYCKDRGDHVSKQGSGRVALFKATKNPACWTMECNYNMSKVNNVLQRKKSSQTQKIKVDENSIQQKIIIEYKQFSQVQAKQFFTIETYHKLGKQVCQSFLDLIQKNPQSRIENPQNYFKSISNLKMYLAVSLLRMAPNRFQPTFRKIFSGLSLSDSSQINLNSLKSMYFLIVKNAKIPNINDYIKTGDVSLVILPQPKKQVKKIMKVSTFRTRQSRYTTIKSSNLLNQSKNNPQQIYKEQKNKIQNKYLLQQQQFRLVLCQRQSNNQQQTPNLYERNEQDQVSSDDLENDKIQIQNNQTTECYSPKSLCISKTLVLDKQQSIKKLNVKLQQFRMLRMNNKRNSLGPQVRQSFKSYSSNSKVFYISNPSNSKMQEINFFSKTKPQQLPFLGIQKYRDQVRKIQFNKRSPNKEQFLFIS